MASASEVKQRLVECLRELHLPTFREGFEDLARRAVQESLSYERYLLDRPSASSRPGVHIGLSGFCASRGCSWKRAWRPWT